MAGDAVGLLDHLGVETAHVVGASMGGMIGQLMAVRFPERVRTFTSIMSTTGDPKLPPPQPDALVALMERIPSERQAYIDGWKKVWRVLSGPHYPIGDELAQKLAEFYRLFRWRLAEQLSEASRRGIAAAGKDHQPIAAMLTALIDGLGLQLASDPALIHRKDIWAEAVRVIRAVIEGR